MTDISKIPSLIPFNKHKNENEEIKSMAIEKMKYGYIAVDFETKSRVLAFLGFDTPPTYQDRIEFYESIKPRISEEFIILEAPKHMVENIRDKVFSDEDDD